MSAAVKGRHWTEDEEVELRRRHADGESSRQIAIAMGLPSRNSAIGKLNRLGLIGAPRRPFGQKSPRPDVALHNRQRGPRASKSTRAIYGDWFSSKMHQTPPQAVLGGRKPAPNSRFVQIDELERTNCHWPIGDPREPDFFFCGAIKADDGLPYCPHHAAIAYVPAGAVKTWKIPA